MKMLARTILENKCRHMHLHAWENNVYVEMLPLPRSMFANQCTELPTATALLPAIKSFNFQQCWRKRKDVSPCVSPCSCFACASGRRKIFRSRTRKLLEFMAMQRLTEEGTMPDVDGRRKIPIPRTFHLCETKAQCPITCLRAPTRHLCVHGLNTGFTPNLVKLLL